jgi:two-component system, OmpR family, response regulator
VSQPPGGPVARRVLVTDDDPRLLGGLTKTLRDAGYIVYAIYNGFAACELAVSQPYVDLLITNTRLADLGAPELIRRVRAVKPNLPILHIGKPLPPDASLGSVPSLAEPYHAHQLLTLVEELLRTSA